MEWKPIAFTSKGRQMEMDPWAGQNSQRVVVSIKKDKEEETLMRSNNNPFFCSCIGVTQVSI